MTEAALNGGRSRAGFQLPAALRRLEDGALALALLAMVGLPLAEIALRASLQVGIANAATLVQHLVLVVGMLGAAVAAREGRLLSLASYTAALPVRLRTPARIFAGSVTLLVTGCLAQAAYEFVASEHQAAKDIAYGIPQWLVQAVMPMGFALVAVRTFATGTASWQERGALLVCALVLGLALTHPALDPQHRLWPALSAILVAAALGAPVFIVLGGGALLFFASEALPLAAVPLNHYQLTVNPSLPAIPLFTLAGYVLAAGGAPARLLRVFRALFGRLHGGAALVTVLLTAFFASFTGASGVAILALGGLLMPLLAGTRYPERASIGLITSAGALGALLPPALPLILYAIIARLPIETMFAAALLPALLMMTLLAALGIWRQPRQPAVAPASRGEALAAVRAAGWELAIPLVTFGGLASGLVTPTETAAITAFYVLLIETAVYRDLSLRRDVPRVLVECGLLVGGIVLILGMALAFTNYLIDAQWSERLTEWASAAIPTPALFLLALNAFLLLVGAFMDIYSAIVVVTPLILPIGLAFGIDPVHLGIIFLANLELGFLSPPVGMNLFFASYRFNQPVGEVARAVLPGLGVLALGVAAVTYYPPLSTWLPGLLGSP